MRNKITVDPDKSLYDQKLSVIVFGCRTDRLNEWQMDELADKIVDLENELTEVKANNVEVAMTSCNKYLMNNGLSYFSNMANVRNASRMMAGFMNSLRVINDPVDHHADSSESA